MTETMIERVTKRLEDERDSINAEQDYEHAGVRLARAAIEAMDPLTDKMLAAAFDESDAEISTIERAYTAAIRAALSE